MPEKLPENALFVCFEDLSNVGVLIALLKLFASSRNSFGASRNASN